MIVIRKIGHFRMMLFTITLLHCATMLRAQDSVHGWKVDFKAKSLELLKVEDSANGVEFTLKNVSDRLISAYSVCFDRGYGFRSCRSSDWAESEMQGLSIGSTDVVVIGRREAEEYKNHIVQISAVLFGDGTSAGIDSQIQWLELKRLGRTIEIRRVDDILSSVNEETLNDSQLEILARRVGIAPEEPDRQFVEELSRARSAGLAVPDYEVLTEQLRGSLFLGARNARIDMVRTIEDLRSRPLSSSDPNVVTRGEYLRGLKNHYNTLRLRMDDICKRTQEAKEKGAKEK